MYNFILLVLLYTLVACSGTTGKTATPAASNSLELQKEMPAAKITREGNWTIVSQTEDGNRVYWFLAPETGKVTPAMFKKTVYARSDSKRESVVVSKCDAPKKTCDELMQQFETLSKKYK